MIARVLIVLCLLVLLANQIVMWMMISRIQGDMAYENMRTVHRGEFGQTYR